MLNSLPSSDLKYLTSVFFSLIVRAVLSLIPEHTHHPPCACCRLPFAGRACKAVEHTGLPYRLVRSINHDCDRSPDDDGTSLFAERRDRIKSGSINLA
ncbi:hypothetical protein CDAR_423011 [Caerostris darwini]|uniref:Secreted protein n=1 Tax=Caerostris darwini TaxID=1538125 RepID=A0AAV4TF05_9ARAC|nr:hypothetical protein CDAR_423011 [Caerostris darwini]